MSQFEHQPKPFPKATSLYLEVIESVGVVEKKCCSFSEISEILNPHNSALSEPSLLASNAVAPAYVRIARELLPFRLRCQRCCSYTRNFTWLVSAPSLCLGGDRQGKAACKELANFPANQSAAAGASDGEADRMEPVRFLAAKVPQDTRVEQAAYCIT